MNPLRRCITRFALLAALPLLSGHAAAQGPAIVNPGPSTNGRLDVAVDPVSGLPLVAYQEGASVKALACASADCKSIDGIRTVASVTPSRVRVAFGTDGLPVVSITVLNNGLRFVKCLDAVCATSQTSIIDGTNLGFGDHALLIPPDGRPLIAYYDALNQDLRYVRCGNAACSDGNAIALLEVVAAAGRAPSLALVAGLPQIAYNGGGPLKLAQCGNLDCSVVTAFKVLANDNPAATSIIEGRDGGALVAYEADTATLDTLKLAKCNGGSTCPSVTVLALDSPAGGTSGTGTGVQLRQGTDGLPVMSYFDRSVGTTRFARCTRADCATATLTTVHAPDFSVVATGSTPAALAIGGNGTPVLAYAVTGFSANLTINTCNTRSCQ